MFKRLAFVLALAPFAACGGKAASTADTTPAPATAPAATSTNVVDLGEITVLQGSDAVLKIHANGGTELGGSNNGQVTYQAGPTVHTDGTFESPNGKLGVKLNADGTLTDLTTKTTLPLTVTANAVTITNKDQSGQITLDPDGTLRVPGETGSAVKVTGADTPGKRKLTLALIGLILLPPPDAAPAPAPTAAPTPAPAPAPATKPAPPAKK